MSASQALITNRCQSSSQTNTATFQEDAKSEIDGSPYSMSNEVHLLHDAEDPVSMMSEKDR